MPETNKKIELFEFELSTVMANEDGETICKTGSTEYAAYYDKSKTSTEEICELLEKNGVESLKNFEHAVVLEKQTADKLATLVSRCNDTHDKKAKLRKDMDDVLALLEDSTSLSIPMDEDTSRGLYCLVHAYRLDFRTYERDDAKWIELYDGNDQTALCASGIKKREFDKERFDAACDRLTLIMLMNMFNENIEKSQSDQKSEYKYGWLSLDGEFEESKTNQYDDDAENIIARHKTWAKDYELFLKSSCESCASEYLCKKQGYVLLQAPFSEDKKPLVLTPDSKNLTWAQAQFLHKYFKAHEDYDDAEAFSPVPPYDPSTNHNRRKKGRRP